MYDHQSGAFSSLGGQWEWSLHLMDDARCIRQSSAERVKWWEIIFPHQLRQYDRKQHNICTNHVPTSQNSNLNNTQIEGDLVLLVMSMAWQKITSDKNRWSLWCREPVARSKDGNNGSELYGCFQKYGKTPQILHFKRVFHYKPSILAYPYFWKHPYNASRL